MLRRVGDGRLLGKISQGHLCPSGLGVRLWKHHHEWLPSKRVDLHLGNLHRRTQEADVEDAVDEAGNLAGGQQLPPEVQLEIRKLCAQHAAHAREQLVRGGPGETDRDPSHPSVADQPCLFAGSVDVRKDRPSRSRYCLPAGVRSTLRVERVSS